jgi:hypothetical protein
MLSAALTLVKNSVKTRAQFDIFKVKPIDNLDKCHIPALFAHGQQDSFISPKHC